MDEAALALALTKQSVHYYRQPELSAGTVDAEAQQRACPSDAPTLSYALLLRGQPYRFGCDQQGVLVQDVFMRTHYRMLAKSLEACDGTTVGVFLAFDTRSCANASLLARLSSWVPPNRLRASQPVHATTQHEQARGSLDVFMPSAYAYDVLIMTRFDVRIKTPFRSWSGCQDPTRFGFASQCEPLFWSEWNCTNDILHVVPRQHFWALNATVGEDLPPHSSRRFHVLGGHGKMATITPTACYARSGERADRGIPTGAGHGCFNALRNRVGDGGFDFCWPLRQSVQAPNAYYDCCRHLSSTVSSKTFNVTQWRSAALVDERT